MFEISSDIIEIKFEGNNISPSTISLQELSQNILLLDRLIKPIVEQNNPNIKLENNYIGLEDLGNKSISFRYTIRQNKTIITSSFAILLQAIQSNNVSALPAKTLAELETVSKFNEKWGCNIKLGETVNGQFKKHVEFTDQFKAEKTGTIKGNTTVYGQVEWVGGKEPSITLVLSNGHKVNVSVLKEQAENIRAYSNIGVYGEATWRGKDLILTALTAKEIFPFEKLNPVEGFDYLSNKFFGYNFSTESI